MIEPVKIEKQITPLDDKVQNVENQVLGHQIVFTKSEAMTAPNTDAPTISTNDNAIVNNLRTRINELESALVKLGLIKSR